MKINFYRSVFLDTFNPINLFILIVVICYSATVFISRPIFIGKLSNHFNQIHFDPFLSQNNNTKNELNESDLMRDMQIRGYSNLDTINVQGKDYQTLYFGVDRSNPTVLMLYPGKSILPVDSRFGCAFVFFSGYSGMIKPGFLLLKNGGFFLNFEKANNKEYGGDMKKGVELAKTPLISFFREDEVAFVIIGRDVNLLDAFFYKIPRLRFWKRKAMVIFKDKNTGKLIPN